MQTWLKMESMEMCIYIKMIGNILKRVVLTFSLMQCFILNLYTQCQTWSKSNHSGKQGLLMYKKRAPSLFSRGGGDVSSSGLQWWKERQNQYLINSLFNIDSSLNQLSNRGPFSSTSEIDILDVNGNKIHFQTNLSRQKNLGMFTWMSLVETW